MATKLNVAYIKTTGANTYDVLRVGATGNLEYANSSLTTSNVIESNTNLYYTNARVYSNVISLLNAKANVTDLTTANVNELASSGNLYYTNARVYSNVISLLPTLAGTGISISGSGVISASASGTTTSADMTTANVIELASSGNIYYTNTRVRSNVIALLPTLAGTGIAIAANGQISSNVSSAGVVYANTQVIIGSNSYVNYNLTNSGATNTSIIVAVEGLVQIPGVDYYVSGQTLTLTSAPDANANIEVRYLGTAAVSQFSPLTSMDIISSFLLMGA